MKHCLKCKTNWAQLPFVALVVAALAYPGVQEMVCKDGHFIMGAQICVTLLARNLWSNVRVRK